MQVQVSWLVFKNRKQEQLATRLSEQIDEALFLKRDHLLRIGAVSVIKQLAFVCIRAFSAQGKRKGLLR